MKMDQKTGTALTVCLGCDGGAALAKALGAKTRTVTCMNVCDKPATISLRSPGKWAYLFADVTPAMATEVATLLKMYEAAPDGDITDARAIPQLRTRLLGRVPG